MAETAAYQPILSRYEWELDEGSTLWPATDHAGLDDAVVDLVDELPEPMRSVVELRIWGRMTFDDIATDLDLASRGSAHVLFTRALEQLKEGLSDGQ